MVWGNHDASWMGACLGHEGIICQVLRISLRYRRLLQLEEGYGIPLAALERLARTVYGDDPAESFAVKGTGMRESITVARMQKVAAVMQFKLEGRMIARHPEWGLEHRRLLHRIDRATGTVEVDGVVYPLKDTRFPTIDPADPYALSPEERECLERVHASFLASQKLWDQIRWMVAHGHMHLVREGHLIFHGCVPVDEHGEFLPMAVAGQSYRGKAVTIDGAFSQACGDHGFTLVLEPLRTFIATHHHFESVQAALERGADIVPSRTVVREWEQPRRVADSGRGQQLRFVIERLEQLIEAYRHHDLPQRLPGSSAR